MKTPSPNRRRVTVPELLKHTKELHRFVRKYVLRRTRQKQLSEDIADESLCRLYLKVRTKVVKTTGSSSPLASCRKYVSAIARNALCDRIRDQERQERHEQDQLHQLTPLIIDPREAPQEFRLPLGGAEAFVQNRLRRVWDGLAAHWLKSIFSTTPPEEAQPVAQACIVILSYELACHADLPLTIEEFTHGEITNKSAEEMTDPLLQGLLEHVASVLFTTIEPVVRARAEGTKCLQRMKYPRLWAVVRSCVGIHLSTIGRDLGWESIPEKDLKQKVAASIGSRRMYKDAISCATEHAGGLRSIFDQAFPLSA